MRDAFDCLLGAVCVGTSSAGGVRRGKGGQGGKAGYDGVAGNARPPEDRVDGGRRPGPARRDGPGAGRPARSGVRRRRPGRPAGGSAARGSCSATADSTGGPAATPGHPGAGQPAPGRPDGRNRPAAAHEALNRAIELRRQGAYEQAAVRLHEADALKEFLTATESRELANLLRSNRSDLQARKQARALLSRADRALREGDKSRGQELLHELLPVERAWRRRTRSGWRKCAAAWTTCPGCPSPTATCRRRGPG